MNVYYHHLPAGGGVQEPNMIVVHCMAEYILDPRPISALDFLESYELSAHSLVAPDGTIYVCRDDDQIAWHARGYNTGSLGIEFLVPGEHNYASFIEAIKEPYLSTQQWAAGIQAVQFWLATYDIKRLVRHSDISPGRKVDPGDGFPWSDFLNEVGWEET